MVSKSNVTASSLHAILALDCTVSCRGMAAVADNAAMIDQAMSRSKAATLAKVRAKLCDKETPAGRKMALREELDYN